MTGFDREYAILLPNGELLTNHTGCDHSHDAESVNPMYVAIFGPPPTPEQIAVRVTVFQTAQQAQSVVDSLRTQARKFGVDDLCVRVVGRVCGPWQTPHEGEVLSQQILDYIAGEQQ